MAIAFDAVSSGSTASATSLSVAHTVTGSNTLGMVNIDTNNAIDILTGATFNGSAMTLAAATSTLGVQVGYNYYKYAPSTGNVVATFSVASLIGIQTCTYSGVSQTGFPDASQVVNNIGSGGTTLVCTVTTTVDNCWCWSAVRNDNSISITSGGTTRNNSLFGGVFAVGDSNGAVTPAGSKTITWTSSAISTAHKSIFSFAPFVATVNSNFFPFF